MKKIFLRFCAFLLMLLPMMVFAQDETVETPVAEVAVVEEEKPLVAQDFSIAVPSESVQVGRNLILRSSNGGDLSDEELQGFTFSWELGDGSTVRGREIVHNYQNPGQYLVKMTVSDGTTSHDQFMELFVYEKLYVVMIDSPWNVYKDRLLEAARDQGIYLSFIEHSASSSLATVEGLATTLKEKRDELESASLIFAGEHGRRALDAFSTFKKDVTDFDFSKKTIIVSTQSNLVIFSRIAGRSLSIINSKKLLLTEQDLVSIIYELLSSPDEETFITRFEESGKVQVVDKSKESLGVDNFISYFINEAISRGMPGDLFLFILLIPVIATLIAFFKQVIGLDTLGIFMPSVLTLSFVLLGLKSALIILAVIVLINMLIRWVMNRFYLLYVPKMAIVVSISALAMLAMILVGVYFDVNWGIDVSQGTRAILSIFPLIIMAMLAEQIMNIQNSKGPRSALRILAEMIFTCVMAYGFVTWDTLRTFVFAFPELVVLITLVIDVILGRFTGLRLMEYLRFRDLLFHESEE